MKESTGRDSCEFKVPPRRIVSSQSVRLNRLLGNKETEKMKKDIHPDYHPVVFKDTSTGDAFMIQSTATSKSTIEWEDGNTYPVVAVEISSKSHPFYTGKMKFVDSAGRVEKFQKKYNWDKRNASEGEDKKEAE